MIRGKFARFSYQEIIRRKISEMGFSDIEE